MGDPKSLSSNEAGFKKLPSHAPRVLLVEEKSYVRAYLADRISRQYAASVELAVTIGEANEATRARQFDIIIFGNSDWEEAVLLYLDLLNRQRSLCQFILFVDDEDGLVETFDGLIKVVRKLDFDALLEAADWLVNRSSSPASARWSAREFGK